MLGDLAHHLFRIVGWSQWTHVPWLMWKSPLVQWQELPSFLIGEYLFLTLSLCALLHASRNSRLHVLVWFLTFIVGTANDVVFMALPTVDNFWQAQATIMLTPRLPLYIPCVYNAFMYWPTVTAWRFDLPLLGESALAGILAGLFYFPYDLTGVTFLWWTWHDTYAGLRYRILNVPTGSTLWTVTFVFCFAFWLRLMTSKNLNISFGGIIKTSIVCILFTTATMMAQMGVLQLFGIEGLPSWPALSVCVVAYLILVFKSSKKYPPQSADHFARFVITVYFLTLVCIGTFGKPEDHVGIGLHQPAGQCYKEQFDVITSTNQYEYLCVTDFDESYDFHCQQPPADTSTVVDWFTVCGKKIENFPLWFGTLTGVISIALAAFSFLLRDSNFKYLTVKNLKTD